MKQVYQQPLNASATHQLGQKANSLVEEARQEIKNLLNAQNYEIIFTSGATEATNQVFFGSDVEYILFSKIEHSCVFNCRPDNKKIIEIGALENGLINFNELENNLEKLASSNFLISAMLANNESGAIQEIEKISKLAHQKGGLIHCDIAQAVGKISVDLEKLNIDFASISAHKFNGPQGVGALLIRKGLDLKPLIFGGGQEKSKRSGTLNIAGIAGFGEACKNAKNKIEILSIKIKALRDYLENEIFNIAKNDVKIFSQTIERLPNTSFIALKNSDSQTQLINFDLNGICVSAGAACSSGTVNESRTLKAMQISDEFIKGAIRVSLGVETTKDEIDKFIKIWQEFYLRTKK